MISKNIVVIVESPLQLINSLEYLNKKGISTIDVKFYLINPIGSINKFQLEKIANLFSLDFKTINLFSVTKLGFHLHLLCTFINFHFIKYSNNIKHVIFGNSKSSQLVGLVNIIFSKNTTLVDDGTSSIRLINNLDQNIEKTTSLKYLFYKLLGIDTQNVQFNEFFTSYQFVNSFNLKFSVVNNEGDLLKKRFQGANRVDEIYFIGAPLVELGIVEKYCFFKMLKSISELSNMKATKVIYYPHRREEEVNLEAIEKITKWQIRRVVELPFELNLLERGVPIEVSGFFSSVLNNMKTYKVKTKLTSYVIPQNFFLKDKQFYSNIYENFHNKGIELVTDFIANV